MSPSVWAAAGLVAGAVPFLLAFLEVDAFPVQLLAALLADGLAITALTRAGPGQTFTRILSIIALLLSTLFLLALGLLYLLWPK